MIMEFTFRSQGSHNQTELSNELVEHLSQYQMQVPEHEDDEQGVRFVLCSYKRARAPPQRRSGPEHRITRDDGASADDWSLTSLRHRHPDLQYRGQSVIFVGALYYGIMWFALLIREFILTQLRDTATLLAQSPRCWSPPNYRLC
jgi:hypothetical protein